MGTVTKVPGPPIDEVEDRGGGGGWRLLTVAKDAFTSHLIEGLLLDQGIDSVLDDFNPTPGAFLKPFGDPLAPVRIFVRSMDFERSTLLLHEVEHDPPDPDASPPKRVKFLWLFTMAVVLVSALLSFIEIFGFAPCVLRLFCF